MIKYDLLLSLISYKPTRQFYKNHKICSYCDYKKEMNDEIECFICQRYLWCTPNNKMYTL